MISAKDSSHYNKFVNDRNKALEKILNKHLSINADLLRKALTTITQYLLLQYSTISGKSLTSSQIRITIAHCRDHLTSELYKIAIEMAIDYKKLARVSYLLSKAGEAEALGRAMGEKTEAHLHHKEISEQTNETSQGDDPFDRIYVSLIFILDKAMRAYMMALLKKENTDLMRARVLASFPKKKVVKKPKRVLKNLKEAEAKPKSNNWGMGIIDSAEWDEVAQDYQDDYIPHWRGPESVGDIDIGEAELEERYGWEIEKQITHDFVQTVRDGQMKAANENGITDFVWVAIVDDHTCDDCCGDFGCSDFDGKLTSEVSKMTNGDVDAPPAHFNCRCDIAPYIAEIGDVSNNDLGDFETWLS